jgi:predicted PolB exonuclease-like 3'-5' exonuclease
VDKLREVTDPAKEDGYDPAAILDPDLADVEGLVCGTLVFDIETVPGVERRELSSTVAEALGKWAEKKDMEPASAMGLSPWFGKVVSLAFAEGETPCRTEDVTVLFVPKHESELRDCPPWMRPMSEARLLRTFWALASRANTVVSFNGKSFDIPFIVMRSLIHGIPARIELTKSYVLQPHLDLYELLGKHSGGPSKLDVVCWALGVESPKGVMDGSMVAPAYDRGEYERIAEYNAHDVRATGEVYRKVRDHILKFRSDWTHRG